MRFAIILAALLFVAQGAQAENPCDVPRPSSLCDGDKIGVVMCLMAFEDSPARHDCSSHTARVIGKDKCKVRATCQKSDGYAWNTSAITVHLQRVGHLRNCDGTLKDGAC